jgi:hypothetical protein
VVQIGAAYWLHVPVGKLRSDRYIPLHPQLRQSQVPEFGIRSACSCWAGWGRLGAAGWPTTPAAPHSSQLTTHQPLQPEAGRAPPVHGLGAPEQRARPAMMG